MAISPTTKLLFFDKFALRRKGIALHQDGAGHFCFKKTLMPKTNRYLCTKIAIAIF
jgi:hypothetical protein